jgi:arylsulfatase A-like enzyme
MPTISRRQLLAAAGASASVAACATDIPTAEAQTRPNILWLVSEDNNPFAGIGAYGDRLARTPSIDGLARRGLLYTHAYANAPVCALSRFGILTGAYPESYAPAQHMRASARVADLLRGYPEYLREAGYYCSNNDKTDYNCDIDPRTIWDDSSSTAHWRNRPAGSPFMSVFNYLVTHESMINRNPGPQHPVRSIPPELQAMPIGHVMPSVVRVPDYLPDTPEVRQDIANYYGRVAQMDAQIGARLAQLDADGLTDNTIIFYYSDHGGALPRSKRFCYEEGLHTCLVIAVPPRYAHLALAPMGSVIDDPVGFIDLPPTLMALARISQPAHMVGRSLLGRRAPPRPRYVFGARDRMDERYDFTRTATDGRYRYLRNYAPHRPWGQNYSNAWLNVGYQEWERCYLAGSLSPIQARFFQTKPYEELYDLDADRDEVRDLATQPEHAVRLEAFRRALDEHMLAINDNGFIPEGSPLEDFALRSAPDAYPLQHIMDIASAAARQDVSHLASFEAGLSDVNEIVRYWSAMGLLILGARAAPTRPSLLSSMNQDPSPHVRIVTAELLAKIGPEGPAVDLLAQFLDHPLEGVRLQAINALTFIGPAVRAVLPAIERKATEAHSNPFEWTLRAAARYLHAVLTGAYTPNYRTFELGW